VNNNTIILVGVDSGRVAIGIAVANSSPYFLKVISRRSEFQISGFLFSQHNNAYLEARCHPLFYFVSVGSDLSAPTFVRGADFLNAFRQTASTAAWKAVVTVKPSGLTCTNRYS
jgi:hypothetical protein